MSINQIYHQVQKGCNPFHTVLISQRRAPRPHTLAINMFSLTKLVTSLALLAPLTRAAELLNCGADAAMLPTGELQALQAAILANQFAPQSVRAANKFVSNIQNPSFSSQVRLGSIMLCIQNPFIFESTTVFPDEMAELITLYMECQRSLAAGNGAAPGMTQGLLDGDTGLDVLGSVIPTTFSCT
jgi:hypothetical protein